MRHRITAAVVLVALASSAGALQELDPERALIPDQAAQAAIRAAVSADVGGREAALVALGQLATADDRELVRQLFLYSRNAASTRDGMAFGVLRENLRLSDASILAALVPLLESRHAGFLRSVHGVLSEFEHAAIDRPPSLAAYRPFLDRAIQAGDPPPPGLVRYLYDRHAGAALLLLTRVHRPPIEELREILLAEHEIEDVLWRRRHAFLDPELGDPVAQSQLEALAGHTRWFARLYVAEVLAEHGAFRTPALLERLGADENALVRERIALTLRQPDPGPGQDPRRR